MNDSDLWEILNYWSYWEARPQMSIPRQLALPPPDPQLVLAIQGVRRCGKSTLLAQLMDRWEIPGERCLFVNFEDPRMIPHLGPELLSRICELFVSRRPPGSLWFFFDEVQNVPQWESWLHMRLERNRGDHFAVTGSNASLLSGELSSRLTGRHRLAELYPFDFQEAKQALPELTPESFLAMGGFPKILLSEGDLSLRQQYFLDIVERDITNRVGARSSGPVRAVIQMVFETCGSEMSLRRVAGVCGLSVETVSGYLLAAEAAYLLFSCPFFGHSTRQQLVRNKKYYPVDTGLRKAVVAGATPDLGKALECATFLALRKRFGRVFYWRHVREVDFVVTHQGRPLPVQVSWASPHDRHHLALDEFYQAFPASHEGRFLNRDDLVENFAAGWPLSSG